MLSLEKLNLLKIKNCKQEFMAVFIQQTFFTIFRRQFGIYHKTEALIHFLEGNCSFNSSSWMSPNTNTFNKVLLVTNPHVGDRTV